MLAIKYISTSKEILELWLHIRIFLSSNKIQLLQKQEKQQLKTTLLKFKRQDYRILFYILCPHRKYGKYALFSNQSNFHVFDKNF